jgi:dienelactone hydrolase
MRQKGTRLVICAALAAAAAGLLAAPIRASTPLMVGVKHNMEAVLFAPPGSGPFPGVLELHATGGPRQGDLDFASQLADQGFVVLVPSFMKAHGITPQARRAAFTTEADGIYADLVSAIDTLRGLDSVHGGRVGVVGFADGGYFAAWLAATGRVQAAVTYYGDFAGAGTDKDLTRFRQLFTSSSAPMLILHGGDDYIDPVDGARHLATILDASHTQYDIELYPRTGNEFDRSIGRTDDRMAAADAWDRTVAFLAQVLK